MIDPAPALPALWHYTCEHGNASIEDSAQRAGSVGRGLIRPGLDGWVWATDLDVPAGPGATFTALIRNALGLTSHSLTCDRMSHRWALDPLGVEAYCRPWLDVRRDVDPVRRATIEGAPGAMLRHWWVAATPLWGERA